VKENKATSLRNLNLDELAAREKQLREELFNLEFRNSVKQVENPLLLRATRRDIARIQTVLREHNLGLRRVASGRTGN
jgi:large subunit ribosomal protein L29